MGFFPDSHTRTITLLSSWKVRVVADPRTTPRNARAGIPYSQKACHTPIVSASGALCDTEASTRALKKDTNAGRAAGRIRASNQICVKVQMWGLGGDLVTDPTRLDLAQGAVNLTHKTMQCRVVHGIPPSYHTCLLIDGSQKGRPRHAGSAQNLHKRARRSRRESTLGPLKRLRMRSQVGEIQSRLLRATCRACLRFAFVELCFPKELAMGLFGA